jgi:hypothetical protein
MPQLRSSVGVQMWGPSACQMHLLNHQAPRLPNKFAMRCCSCAPQQVAPCRQGANNEIVTMCDSCVMVTHVSCTAGLDMETVERSMIEFGENCLKNGTRYR